jgi:hypothetical protein
MATHEQKDPTDEATSLQEQVTVRYVPNHPASPGGYAYHVLNRAVTRLPLFEGPADYDAFQRVSVSELAVLRRTAREIASAFRSRLVVADFARGQEGK